MVRINNKRQFLFCAVMMAAGFALGQTPEALKTEAPKAEVTKTEASKTEAPKAEALKAEAPKPDADGWISLFNGKDLTGWSISKFGGEGEVTVENGEMTISMGAMMSGIRYEGEFPTENYEIEIVAKRTMGQDFFAMVTFPIGKEFASYVTGGWGGNLFGISCVNGQDASENEFMQLVSVKSNQWYNVRVRVTKEAVECFLDGKSMLKVKREGNTFKTRFEADLSRPFGIANYCCQSVIKSIRYSQLDAAGKILKPAEAQEAPKK